MDFNFRCGYGWNKCNCDHPDDCGYIEIFSRLKNEEGWEFAEEITKSIGE
jgi:hypothetical protein